MKTNYLLIDFENVQPKTLSLLNGAPFKVFVFLGANQSKVSVEFAKELQKLGSDAEYIQISGNGSNALDFHIAFTVGELSKTDPTAYFHIISQDAGFDPLIEYARKKGVLLHRSKEIGDIPLLKLSNAKTTTEKVTAILNNLIPRGASRPRKVRTLSSTINALFKKELSETELAELIASLKKGGHISIEGENVTYHIRSTV
ncbi:MAG: PIN domain-containing protein [Thermoguttaceae bacterium]